jgi:hypothetical protein
LTHFRFPDDSSESISNPFEAFPAQDVTVGFGENFSAMNDNDIKNFMDAEEEVRAFFVSPLIVGSNPDRVQSFLGIYALHAVLCNLTRIVFVLIGLK